MRTSLKIWFLWFPRDFAHAFPAQDTDITLSGIAAVIPFQLQAQMLACRRICLQAPFLPKLCPLRRGHAVTQAFPTQMSGGIEEWNTEAERSERMGKGRIRVANVTAWPIEVPLIASYGTRTRVSCRSHQPGPNPLGGCREDSIPYLGTNIPLLT